MRNPFAKRFRNSITHVKGYPGADCGSDHVLLISTFTLRLKKIRCTKKQLKLDLEQLKGYIISDKYCKAVRNAVGCVAAGSTREKEEESLDVEYGRFVEAVTKAGKDITPQIARPAKQAWIPG